MKLKKFNSFESVNEGSKVSKLKGDITLYRLTSHSVIDLSNPGEYYVFNKSNIDPSLLDKKGKKLFLITIKTDSSNIDLDESEKECAKLNCDCIVAVKSNSKCEVVKVEPYKE